jgi:hypothetical protein
LSRCTISRSLVGIKSFVEWQARFQTAIARIIPNHQAELARQQAIKDAANAQRAQEQADKNWAEIQAGIARAQELSKPRVTPEQVAPAPQHKPALRPTAQNLADQARAVDQQIPKPERKTDDEGAICAWLHSGSKSAKYLVKRPVIGLFPKKYFGKLVWLPSGCNQAML